MPDTAPAPTDPPPAPGGRGTSTVGTMYDKVAVVVDGYSTGALYAPAFTAFGIAPLHVQNRTEHSAELSRSFAPETYRACHAFDGDWDALLRALAPHTVGWVVAGTETGVELADRLAAALGLPNHNRPATSALRRDKLAMQQALAAAGVPAAWHAPAGTPQQARAAARAHGGLPVIVKPLRSAGTDGVRVCPDPAAAARAAADLLGSRTVYGQTNATVLVQEYLHGDEYMVNCVSADGRHTVTEIWRSVKTMVAAAPVYDFTELLPAQGPGTAAVVAYVHRVLDALGTRWGPSHTEVIVTAAGPRLVESAARPQGTIDVSAVTRATGRNPVVDAVHAMVDPELYAAGGPPPPARTHRAARGVSFICPGSGRLRSDLDWAKVRALPSYHSLLAPAGRAGEYVRRTSDLFSRPGAVYLVHSDRTVVERDHAAIRRWEREGFYDIDEQAG